MSKFWHREVALWPRQIVSARFHKDRSGNREVVSELKKRPRLPACVFAQIIVRYAKCYFGIHIMCIYGTTMVPVPLSFIMYIHIIKTVQQPFLILSKFACFSSTFWVSSALWNIFIKTNWGWETGFKVLLWECWNHKALNARFANFGPTGPRATHMSVTCTICFPMFPPFIIDIYQTKQLGI